MTTKRDLFTRLRDVLVRFFREPSPQRPAMKKGKAKAAKKPARATKKKVAVRKSSVPKKKTARPTQKKKGGKGGSAGGSQKQPNTKAGNSFLGNEYKKRPEDVPMPAPWSKVTKYKKVKKSPYDFY